MVPRHNSRQKKGGLNFLYSLETSGLSRIIIAACAIGGGRCPEANAGVASGALPSAYGHAARFFFLRRVCV
jgi:hypothetical protein